MGRLTSGLAPRPLTTWGAAGGAAVTAGERVGVGWQRPRWPVLRIGVVRLGVPGRARHRRRQQAAGIG